MRILCIGGGPAGLYFALLMKLRYPRFQIRVVERNRPYDTFGWGVVLSDQTLERLRLADPVTAKQIQDAFNHWDDIEVHFKGRVMRSSGHGFCGIGRKRLLNLLQARCESLGVELAFETNVDDLTGLARTFRADWIIASDGINSRIRQTYADSFKPDIDLRQCRFVWLGTTKRFDAFTFAFEQTEHGWFQAHAYQFDQETSTFIVETPEKVWQAHGLGEMTQDEGIKFCERLFARYLDGHRLMSNASHLRGSAIWIRFPRVICRDWVHRLELTPLQDDPSPTRSVPVILMGDAAHTAHFSIGSGTKLALEDAIELCDSFESMYRQHHHLPKSGLPQSNLCQSNLSQSNLLPHNQADLSESDLSTERLDKVLQRYVATRSVEVLKIQNAARNSTEWFENVDRYADFEIEQFTYSLLTRSQRISHENLRLRDPEWLQGYEAWLAKSSTGSLKRPSLPMMLPLRVRGLELKNRIVVSPMATYSAVDGRVQDFHLVHLGARALGGAALIFTEMTCVSPQGRITPGCPGIWDEQQAQAWTRIVEFVHRQSTAKIGIQLGHSGPKGSTQVGWDSIDEPLVEGNWPLLAASAVPWGPCNQQPKAMDAADRLEVLEAFVQATRRAADAGFDWLELHCAHGYLLSSFICPLTNRREDEYGGSIENRCRFPIEVFIAMRRVWPDDRPMSVRISADDWAPGGNTADDAIVIAQMFKDAGADFIDVSSGQTTQSAKPIYGRMYQTPFADRIRNEVGIRTIAVGAITEGDQVNSIIAAGRADLCAIARPHLVDPAWTLNQSARLGDRSATWPPQYWAGRDQLHRELDKANSANDARPIEGLS